MLKASMLSPGGTGNVPMLHEDLVSRGWANDAQFAESLAVGQISPGPNGLWVICLGFVLGGLTGAILATVAVLIPPFFVLVIDKLYRRVQHHSAVEGFMRGLTLAVVGVFLFVLLKLFRSNGVDLTSVLVALGALGLVSLKKVPVVVIILLSAGVGLIFYR